MPHQCTTCGHAFDDGSTEMLDGCPDCGGTTFQFYPPGTDVPDEPPDGADPPEREEPTGASAVGRAATRMREFVSSGSSDPPDPPDPAPADSPRARADPDAGATSGPDPDPTGEPAPTDGTTDPTLDAGSRESDPLAGEDRSPGGGTTDLTSAPAPDPNAPWPTESEDEDADGDGDDIIDADAREAAHAIDEADADPPDGSAPGSDSPGSSGSPGSPGPSGADADATGLAAAEGGPDAAADSSDGPELAALREQLNEQFESIKILEPGQYELNLMELYDREEYIIALQENGRYVIQVPENWMGDRPGAE